MTHEDWGNRRCQHFQVADRSGAREKALQKDIVLEDRLATYTNCRARQHCHICVSQLKLSRHRIGRQNLVFLLPRFGLG